MTIGPLEAVSNIADGVISTNANFAKPLYDVAKSILGAASGAPDANGGAPSVPRSPVFGFLSFTNALGVTSNPGVMPASVFSTGSAQSVTVPNGQMLVVEQLLTNATTAPLGPAVTLNDGVNTTQVAALTTSGNWFSQWPYVLDQNWIVTTPTNAGWRGFYVLRDVQITPVARQVTHTGATRYTVPNGFTLWLLGAVGVDQAVVLQDSGSIPICPAPYNVGGGAYNTGPGNGNGVSGSPIPIAAGTIVQSSDASHAASFWGVLI